MAEDDGGYAAFFDGLAAFEWERDVVRVAGPEAGRYLQGQLSQDVSSLPEGGSTWSLLLQPQGKLVALVRVYRRSSDEFFLDSDAGVGPAMVERLLRFKLRTKADVEQLDWRVVAVRGPQAVMPEAVEPQAAVPGDGALAVPFRWGALQGYDLFAPGPFSLDRAAPAVATRAAGEAYEAARVEAGFPRHGAELDERTIPAEAGLVTVAVSFTKGCYTGQELVARIDARGSNVARRLYGLLLTGPGQPGATLYEAPEADEAEKAVGSLTSVAWSPRSGWVGLCYVKRGLGPGHAVHLQGEGGQERGEVRALPMVPTGA